MEAKGSLRHLQIFTETQFTEKSTAVSEHFCPPPYMILELLVDVMSSVWAVRGGRSHADLILDTEH